MGKKKKSQAIPSAMNDEIKTVYRTNKRGLKM